MKLLDLYINGFGKFHGKSIEFQDGLNVVYGKNEAGKSTLHTFIRGMLFGIERGRGRVSKNDLYTKYEPWENSADYQGRLRLESGGHTYRIERKFSKNNKEVHVIDETLGKEISPDKAFYDQVLCGLTETTYNNTISIGQLKSATDSAMVSELKNYIANLNTSGSMALNITRAAAFLKKQKKDLENQIVPEAARNYTTLLGEIRSIEQEIAAPEFENQLSAYRARQKDVNEQLAKKREEREELIQKIAKGRQILNSNQFDGEESIRAYLQKAEKVYEEYKSAKSASEKKSRTVLSVICFLLAALSAALSAAVFSGLLSLPLPSLQIGGLLLVPAAVFLFLGIFLQMRGKRYQKELELSAGLIREIFARHLGDSSISDDAMNALSERMEEFIRLNAALEKSETSMREQQEEIQALQEQSESCSTGIENQQRLQWELEKKLERLSFCRDQVAALQRVIDENDRLRDEITAIDLALETMTEVSTSIRSSFGLLLNKTASDLIAGITGGTYSSMSVDENLNIFMNTRTKLVPIEQVSSGTMDQIYLALRLAVARLMQGEQEPLPLIFDDSFVQYDDERLRTALSWLSRTYDGQCIIFTCHKRELQILNEEKIPYHQISI
ncbi:MAG TPA: AAA family ATPase [Candidatus Lachnoclostridium stercorigallinarum]|uniref:AAA family ATPase n=1 Tax=Candidatus Lachnoclostridium stercorigallinarum TaxID=2838634 RepID=A0A9D2GHL3_9FIRM|nr:AAA family ATPase [Candidatus Lachnoclostridium stercorigallinarum]